MQDDLNKAFPASDPVMWSHWDEYQLEVWRAALKRERFPAGKYVMTRPAHEPMSHETKKQPKDWLSQHFGNGTDWTGNGRLGGKQRK